MAASSKLPEVNGNGLDLKQLADRTIYAVTYKDMKDGLQQ
jgi:hypothetical protein